MRATTRSVELADPVTRGGFDQRQIHLYSGTQDRQRRGRFAHIWMNGHVRRTRNVVGMRSSELRAVAHKLIVR